MLNASGGMEKDLVAANPGYPMAVNRDAPLMLLDLARPKMPRGGVVIHVTSHLAHFYGRVDQIPEYEPVAESKHAGEEALLAVGFSLAPIFGPLTMYVAASGRSRYRFFCAAMARNSAAGPMLP